MIETANPKINVENLMQRIREEVARRKAQTPHSQTSPAADAWPELEATVTLPSFPHAAVSLSRIPESDGCLAHKPEYAFTDFLAYHDEDFVRSAYRCVLQREPDAGGLAHYLDMLRTGRMSKAEILGRLRYSSEGKTCAVPIHGLLLPFALQSAYHIPVLGYGLALANFIVRLPTIVRNWQRFEAYTLYKQREQVRQHNSFASQVEIVINQAQHELRERDAQLVHLLAGLLAIKPVVDEIGPRMDDIEKRKANVVELAATTTRIEESLTKKADATLVETLASQINEKIFTLTQALETKANNERLTQLTNHLVELVQRKADAGERAAAATPLGVVQAQKTEAATIQRETREIQRQILDQQRRLVLLENMAPEEDHQLDAFYVSFEDRFRGTREDIKQRVVIYLPIVKEAKVGTKDAPILDIGCGRGEWLELLQENDLVARGIDLNRVMVSRCQELGLEVTEAEALAYLRGLKTNSLGAVTGMHIIEHIPFNRLVTLFDEVLRVLKPGGVAIFETPNPENLIVGSCNFYYDPTHLNPLPPESMQFVMEARGFGGIDILRLHPSPELNMLKEDAAQMQHIIYGLIYGPQDYALIARKS